MRTPTEPIAHRPRPVASSLALLRATLEATTDGMLVTDAGGRVTEVNASFARLWNLPQDVVAGGDHAALVEATSRLCAAPEAYRAHLREIEAVAPPETHDLLQLADGRVLERVSRALVIEGHTAGRAWTFRDVTEARRAERALRQQADWLRTALASIGDAVLSTDADARVTFLNGVAERLTGWTRAEAVGQPITRVFHAVEAATRRPIDNPALRALAEGRVVGLANHAVLIARDGSERPVDDSAAPMLDDAGNTIGSILVFRDVTERMRAEEVRARLAAIVESSEDAIVSKTRDGVIQSWNAGAERLFGWSAAEAIGRPITLVIPPERHEEEQGILERICRGERVEHFDTVRVRKDGRPVDVSLTISPVRDAYGRIVGASKVARDITERKQAEIALREADRRKDEFLALLAHELRNPLAPLRNGLHIMRLGASDANAVGRARAMMERQLAHLVRLVDDLLDVSRISRGKMNLRRSRVLLSEVLSSAVETARPAIEAAEHQLFVSIPQEPITLDADLTRLAQVFGNLLTNSAKYTQRGGRIWVTAERQGPEIVVTVRDTGIGIPREALPYVFDMFAQVDRSVERASGGLGIGLALVRGLVEMHGGTVTAASDGPGKGSTFTVRLPAPDPRPDGRDAGAESDGPVAPRSRRRILVVDDNRDAAASMAMMLELLGNEVFTVHDGLDAVHAAERLRPDVLLLDVGMPCLNGYEAARRIRSEPWGRGMVIVTVTGWGQDEDRQRARESGCDAHLVKPIELSQLERILVDRAPGVPV